MKYIAVPLCVCLTLGCVAVAAGVFVICQMIDWDKGIDWRLYDAET